MASSQEKTLNHKLVITGKEPTPIEICKAKKRELLDFRTTHEEADVIIIQQVVKIANMGAKSIRVICDDADVFVLLMYFFQTLGLSCVLTMESNGSNRTLIDIGASAEKHKTIIPSLPGAHALTGCDTVAQCFGIGKATAIKVLYMGNCLQALGRTDSHIDNVIQEATAFMAACYGSTKMNNMSDVRVNVWSMKTVRQKATAAPQLKNLPPTTEAFELNVRRAHIQTAFWMSACEAEPPALDPTMYGWKSQECSKSLISFVVA